MLIQKTNTQKISYETAELELPSLQNFVKKDEDADSSFF